MLGDPIGGDLKRSGAAAGATSQAQAFTQGLKIDSIEDISGSGIALEADLVSDRWLASDTNTFFGVGVAAAGNLLHSTGSEGYRNTAVGSGAMYSITDGELNTGIGYYALYSITSGSRNLAMGQTALDSLTSGNDNSGQGNATMTKLTTGGSNVGFGGQALYNALTCSYNTAVGHQALYDNTANYNSALGYRAGYNATAASCVYLGALAGQNNAANNRLYIDNSNSAAPLIYGEFDNNVIKINGELRITGDVGGESSSNSITGATDTPSSDPGWSSSSSSDMNAPDGYIKAYVGTQAVVLPYWNT